MIWLLLLQAGFAGNRACAPCHPAIHRSYMQTPMASSSGVAGADITAGSFRHAPSSVLYRIYRERGKAFLGYERDPALRGAQELHYFIGSLSAGRSYIYSIDRFLYQAPVTYYSQAKRWDMSPGYEQDRQMQFNRPIEPGCLYCHASQVRPIFGTQNRYAEPPFAENGVGCERCHGPGAAHVQGKGPMVNPARLDPARRDAVCAQCHLTGEARIERPGKRLAMYRPGDLLSDYASYFAYEDAAESGLKATSHVEKLAQSLCKRRSGDRLWCGSCHDPHFVPAPSARAAYFRDKCLACHRDQRCSRGDDCAACHMPKARVVDGGHGVLTDHRIPRLPSEAASPPAGRRLVLFGAGEDDPRALGWAYAETALRTNDEFHKSEAFRLLTQALPRYPDDAAVLLRLAHLCQGRGEADRAAALYEAALREDPHSVVAAVNLGAIYGQRGRLDRAIALWQGALASNPGLSEAGLNLALALRSKGERARAVEVLRQVLRFNPDFGRARELLRELSF